MQVTRSGRATSRGPAEWFTGDVFIDPITPGGASRVTASNVHFTPAARTAWHAHPNGQTVFVTEGVGLVQRRDGKIQVVRAGDSVFFELGESHWHGAAPSRFTSHVSIGEVDEDGSSATCGQHVTDDEYAAAASIGGGSTEAA